MHHSRKKLTLKKVSYNLWYTFLLKLQFEHNAWYWYSHTYTHLRKEKEHNVLYAASWKIGEVLTSIFTLHSTLSSEQKPPFLFGKYLQNGATCTKLYMFCTHASRNRSLKYSTTRKYLFATIAIITVSTFSKTKEHFPVCIIFFSLSTRIAWNDF